MTDKTKKIIAREGLIIAGFIVIAWILDAIVYLSSYNYPRAIGAGIKDIHHTIFIIFLVYVIVRFIIWAVKTLKGK